jgi:hypothetical protein
MMRDVVAVRWIAVGLVLGSLALGPVAGAGFQNPPPSQNVCNTAVVAPICTCPTGTPARNLCDYISRRAAYYAASYAGENGPYVTIQEALNAALMASYWYQSAEERTKGEYGSIIFVDRYGMFWFTDSKKGVQISDGSWSTTLFRSQIRRPETAIAMVEHSHPVGVYDPTGSGTSYDGDNASDYRMIVIRGDDTLWYFPPNTHSALYYGVIQDGQVVTKYTQIGSGATNEIDFSKDPYKIAGKGGSSGGDWSWIDYTVAIALASGVISGTVLAIIAAAGASTLTMGPGDISTDPGTSPECNLNPTSPGCIPHFDRVGSFLLWQPAEGDTNLDGYSDIVLSGLSTVDYVPIALNDGAGNFRSVKGSLDDARFATWTTVAGTKVVAGDFDGDGRSDIAVTGGAGWQSLPVAFSNGDGSYHVVNTYDATIAATFAQWATQATPVAGDFDGDGKTDIALVGVAGWATIPVAFSNGDGTFRIVNTGIQGDTNVPQYSTHPGATALAGNFAGRGRAHLILAGGQGWTTIPECFFNRSDDSWYCTNNGNFGGDTSFTGYADHAQGGKLVAGDFDGDGITDLAVVGGAGWTNMPIAFSDGLGGWQVTAAPTNFPAYSGQAHVTPVVGDFNHDGKSDISLTGGIGWGSLPIAYSVGDGTFTITNNGPDSQAFDFPALAAGVAKVVGGY